MAEPGIKGAVFAGIVEHVRELRDAGKIRPEELEHRLGPEGMAVLEAKIQPAIWYPIQVYASVRELLRDVEGKGKDQYTIDAAAASARRMMESGLYQQLDYLNRWKQWTPSGDPVADQATRAKLFRQQLAWMSTLYASMYNFGTSKIAEDPEFPDRFQLEYWDEGVMPAVGRLAVLGFWSEISLHWSSERRPGLWAKVDFLDHYLLRMTRGIAEI